MSWVALKCNAVGIKKLYSREPWVMVRGRETACDLGVETPVCEPEPYILLLRRRGASGLLSNWTLMISVGVGGGELVPLPAGVHRCGQRDESCSRAPSSFAALGWSLADAADVSCSLSRCFFGRREWCLE